MEIILCFSSSKNKELLISLWFPPYLSPLSSFQDSRAKSSISYRLTSTLTIFLISSKRTFDLATTLIPHLLRLLTISGWPSIKEWLLCSSYLTSPKPSILFVTISFCIRFLTFVYPILSPTSSSLISLADFSVFADWVALIHIIPEHLFSSAFLKAQYLNYYSRFSSMTWGFSLRHCHHLLYVDDLQINLHFLPRDLELTLKMVREDIVVIEQWPSFNRLPLNAVKPSPYS